MTTYIEKTQKIFNKKSFANFSKKRKEFVLSSEHNSKIFYIIYNNQFKDFHATVTNVSSSGMSRWIKFALVTNKGEFINLDWFMAQYLDNRFDNRKGLFIRGCGMDMIFNELYTLVNSMYGYKSPKSKIHDKLIMKANYYRSL